MHPVLLIWLIAAVAWDAAYLIQNRRLGFDAHTLLDCAVGAIFAPLMWVLWLVLYGLPAALYWIGEKVAG